MVEARASDADRVGPPRDKTDERAALCVLTSTVTVTTNTAMCTRPCVYARGIRLKDLPVLIAVQ